MPDATTASPYTHLRAVEPRRESNSRQMQRKNVQCEFSILSGGAQRLQMRTI
jgi:hypothetical protein